MEGGIWRDLLPSDLRGWPLWPFLKGIAAAGLTMGLRVEVSSCASNAQWSRCRTRAWSAWFSVRHLGLSSAIHRLVLVGLGFLFYLATTTMREP